MGRISAIVPVGGLDNSLQSEEGYGVKQSDTRGRQERVVQTRPGVIRSLIRAVVPPFAGCVLLAASAVAAHAQSIVVRSTGPSATTHPKGQRLSRGVLLMLRAGDIVTILDQVGTRVLRGPGTFRLDGAVVRDNGVITRLSRSLGDPATFRSTSRAGAVRGPGNPGTMATPLPDTIWLADVDAGGSVCVPKGSRAYLWRSSTGSARSGSLGTTDDRVKLNVQWSAQSRGTAWPIGALPLVDGSAYRFTGEGPLSKVVEFRIVALDPAALPVDAAGLGAVLLEKGCTAQFDWLASSLEHLNATPPKAGG